MVMHPQHMGSVRLRARFKDCRLVRMSSGEWCVIRDLGPVKGGKGLKHHEPVMAIGLRRLPLDALPSEMVSWSLMMLAALRASMQRLNIARRPAHAASIRRGFQAR